jgi:hypothetical protein
VDGVQCRTGECRKNPTSKQFSHNFNGSGLAYKLGIAVHKNWLVWINRPFLPSTHDITIFREPNGLMSKIPDGKRAIGDSGYKGESSKFATKNHLDDPEVAKFKNRARACHEMFNGQIKFFKVLDKRLRHGLDKHKVVFEAVCIFTQFELENGNLLMDL